MNTVPYVLTSAERQKMDICVDYLVQMFLKYGASLEMSCDVDE